jgi:hypothetical protein
MIAEHFANMGQGARNYLKHSETSQKVSQEEAAKHLGTTPIGGRIAIDQPSSGRVTFGAVPSRTMTRRPLLFLAALFVLGFELGTMF